jgi:hypothetical protein
MQFNNPTGTKTKTKNMTTLPLTNSISPATAGRGFLLITLALTCFALLPTVRAQLPSPTPDGGYPNENTAEGDSALFSLTTGTGNTANGFEALNGNTAGSFNTANGAFALTSNTTGINSTANGAFALNSNTTGGQNTATGFEALASNTTGTANTATGTFALIRNTTGTANTAIGQGALSSNTTASNNTASGFQALSFNTTGSNNTASGFAALFDNNADNNTGTGANALSSNTTGTQNTATGVAALEINKIGNYNTATGVLALSHTTSGSNNVATGVNALYANQRGRDNTAEGFQALKNSTGSSNIAIGSSSGVNLTTGSNNNIDIGNQGVAGDLNTIRIGGNTPNFGFQKATFIAGIHRVAVTGSAVVVSASGQLGVAPSSARFKEAIKPMDKASEAILQLQPVTFRYNKELDPDAIPQFGLIAEQVEKVNPDLVARDDEGKVYTVRYEAVNAMLLNEFLKEHRRAEEQRKYFEAKFVQQQKQIEALTATVQKVSNQVALSKPAPQLVANP